MPRRQSDAVRVPRKDRRGASPFAVGGILLILVLVVTYLGFTKHIPFTHGYRLNAVFQTSNNLKPGSPVRIAGVNVGKVKKIERYKGTNTALVQMEITDAGLPIHKDATAKIRPRIFLEGNFFVDLHPGTPAAPTLDDDDSPLKVTQTSSPVQLDQILTALQQDPREDLQSVLVDFGRTLTLNPSAQGGTPEQIDAFNATQDPDAKDKSAAEAIQNSYTYSADALRNTSIINQALLGIETDDLSKLLKGLQLTAAGLGRNESQLQGLISNFNITMSAFASEQDNLRTTIRELPPTLSAANQAFDALNASFPPTRAFAREILPGVRESPATIAASFPWIDQVRALVGPAELGGLVDQLQPLTADSASLIDATVNLLPKTDLVSRCVINNILPTGDVVIKDGNLTTGTPNYKEFWQVMVALAGEGQNFDGNGMYVRFQPGGGDQTVSTGKTNVGGGALFANDIYAPIGTRPRQPAKRPPYRPDVPCYTNKPPDLNSAKTGPVESVVSTSRGAGRQAAPDDQSTGGNEGASALPGIGGQLLDSLDPTGKTTGGGEGTSRDTDATPAPTTTTPVAPVTTTPTTPGAGK
jgi:phospholipid/cholesterol/gamma-HCH transport system substrate-binding protein